MTLSRVRYYLRSKTSFLQVNGIMSWTVWLIVILIGLAIIYVVLKYFRIGALEALASKIHEVVEADEMNKARQREEVRRSEEENRRKQDIEASMPQEPSYLVSERYVPPYVNSEYIPCNYEKGDYSGEVVIPLSNQLPDYVRPSLRPSLGETYRVPVLPPRDQLGFPGKGKIRSGSSRGEEICRDTMEKLTGKPFNKARPDWLVNPETGKRLELDCYNEMLRIAIEYNGQQHYEDGHFGMTPEQTIQQWRRDQFKRKMCELHGIHLIVVPYTIPHESIPDYILSNLPPQTFQYAF